MECGVKLGDKFFKNTYDAGAYVIECAESGDITVEDWVRPYPDYDGPSYDVMVRESYRYAGMIVVIRYSFTNEEIEGKDPEDYPYDNGTMEIEYDWYHVVPVSAEGDE